MCDVVMCSDVTKSRSLRRSEAEREELLFYMHNNIYNTLEEKYNGSPLKKHVLEV